MSNQILVDLRGRVASLDGLRAVSIAMVLFSHAADSCNFPTAVPSWVNWFFNGSLGVRIFFVISGFIITLLLLKEEEKDGSFSIKKFYIRRIFRILPVYYIFLFTLLIIDRFADLGLTSKDVIPAFTFTSGWWSGATWMMGHTWSLSVEEQFYLLWPVTLVLVRNKRSRLLLVLACIAIYPAMRIAVYLSPLIERRGFIFITQGDAILFGCLLAILLVYHSDKITMYFTRNVLAIRLVCLSLVTLSGAIQTKAMLGMATVPLSNTIEGICIAWLIGSFILNKDLIYRLLNSRVFVFLGVISYSWYLWQQLFLFECGRYFTGTLFSFPLNVVMSFIAAVASYYVIERTFERMKRNFMNLPPPEGSKTI